MPAGAPERVVPARLRTLAATGHPANRHATGPVRLMADRATIGRQFEQETHSRSIEHTFGWVNRHDEGKSNPRWADRGASAIPEYRRSGTCRCWCCASIARSYPSEPVHRTSDRCRKGGQSSRGLPLARLAALPVASWLTACQRVGGAVREREP